MWKNVCCWHSSYFNFNHTYFLFRFIKNVFVSLSQFVGTMHNICKLQGSNLKKIHKKYVFPLLYQIHENSPSISTCIAILNESTCLDFEMIYLKELFFFLKVFKRIVVFFFLVKISCVHDYVWKLVGILLDITALLIVPFFGYN